MKIIKFSSLLFWFCVSIAYGQNVGEINGKLILANSKDKEFTLKNTYVVLKSKNQIDSVRVDENLNFTFKNVKEDSLRIYIYPRSYPINRNYIIHLKRNEVKKVELQYSPVCPYEKNSGKICPICKKEDKSIPIKYGLILEDDRQKSKRKNYKLGGCVVSDCQPNWFCKRDKIEF
jgi:hypothetical protein